ncbi:PI-actitoxin-Aeq3a-like [Drosophila subobscura]|uniref:PI-actitoxin-Aeq3a-like n=1 Tax=Drosophila subobscura TaxID=7241 RepID=UPI00155A93B7|nr:PI-actitoxin-Aeq3a-like [Drosophila subobscura]
MKLMLLLGVLLALSVVALALKDPICGQLPARQGEAGQRCFAYIRKYTYYPHMDKCQLFIYGGCGGNDNNFKTIEECEATCKENHTQV